MNDGRVARKTVDLSAYPDLVVIMLGMRVNTLFGLKTMFGLGPQIQNAVGGKPDGLLLHEPMLYSLFPMHLVMRQYWRDFDALESFARSEPHRTWWKQFLADSGGTGFWHETYAMRGGIEAIYDDLGERRIGLARFAPELDATGPLFSARERLRR